MSRKFLRRNRAKKLQNFRKSGASRAQNLRASGQRALRIIKETLLKLPESKMRFIPTKLAFGVEITQSRGRIAKFLKIFGAPRAQKIACTRRACALQLA